MTPLLAGALVGGILVYLAGSCEKASSVIRFIGIGCLGLSGILVLLQLIRQFLLMF